MTQTPKQTSRFALFYLTVLSACFHVFMEWIFFVTKPSSLSILSLYEKLNVLIVSSGIFALVPLGILLILSVPAWLVKDPRWKVRLSSLNRLPSALMLTITGLILLDNFTYTVFKFGIVTTLGAWRIIYIGIFILIFRWTYRFIQRTMQTLGKPASYLILGLFAVSIAGILPTYISGVSTKNNVVSEESSTERPNILIIGGDGLTANYMSMYGYHKETTPFLSQLAETSLVAENAFTNMSSTTGSTASMLTGREPATVKIYRYPDVLSGEESYEHLPGILKHQGYKTVEIGTPYYVDARQLNMLDGFDIVNNQSMNTPALDAVVKLLGNSPSTYFIQTVTGRISERLLHIFFIKDMKSPVTVVNDPRSRMTDGERVNQILDLVDQSERPVFVFAHFMDTHGPTFSSENHVFSGDSSGNEEWDQGRYEDAILSFDGSIQRIYDHLAQTGELDNTIIVIYTDHGYKYAINHRIPVIIHFPNDAHAGRRKNNVQIIDVPVTLLDYLGIARPAWMTGESILDNEPLADREIISITAGSPKKIAPPFYQIKTVQVIVCQKWYALNVQENSWKSGLVAGHTSRCDINLLPSEKNIHQKILDYLKQYGYTISSLQ